MTPSRRNAVFSLVLLCISLFVGYAIVEVGYRIFEYRKLRTDLVNSIIERVPNDGRGDSIFDVATGYRYRPNMEVGPRTTPSPVHYHTNSHGLISRDEFPVEKPSNEYRIGFIGDSFTAGVMTTVRWSDIVEDNLNASEAWRKSVGGRHTRCINFGLDGIGTVQFGAVVEDMVRPYNIDLLIVNSLKEDILRRPYHRGFQAAVSKDQIKRYVTHMVAQLPWFGLYPEVFAVTIGRSFGMVSHLSYAGMGKAFWGDRLYDSPLEAADASLASFHKITHDFPNAIFLVDPTYKEYTGVRDPLATEAFDELSIKAPEIHWVMMVDHLPALKSKAEIESWFNVPADQHKNAVGTKIYGDAVAQLLLARLADPGGKTQ